MPSRRVAAVQLHRRLRRPIIRADVPIILLTRVSPEKKSKEFRGRAQTAFPFFLPKNLRPPYYPDRGGHCSFLFPHRKPEFHPSIF